MTVESLPAPLSKSQLRRLQRRQAAGGGSLADEAAQARRLRRSVPVPVAEAPRGALSPEVAARVERDRAALAERRRGAHDGLCTIVQTSAASTGASDPVREIPKAERSAYRANPIERLPTPVMLSEGLPADLVAAHRERHAVQARATGYRPRAGFVVGRDAAVLPEWPAWLGEHLAVAA